MNDETKGLRLGDFAGQAYDKLRYGDTDRQGHVNNAVFATFMETGRVELIYSPQDPLLEDGFSFFSTPMTFGEIIKNTLRVVWNSSANLLKKASGSFLSSKISMAIFGI